MSIANFLFATPPVNFSRSDLILSGIFVAFLIVAISAKIGQLLQAKKNAVSARLLRRLSFGFFSFGTLGIIWVGLRYLSIPYLGIRFVAGLIGLGFLIWLYFILAYILLRFRKDKIEWQHNQIKQKYLQG
jgi:hypothetical protein